MAEGDKNIGRLIGNYRVLAEIGAGGFGKVYRGEHVYLTERTVAIKFLHTHLSSTEEREQFLQEAHFLEKLKHSHMLQVFDVGLDDGFPYLVTEYAPHGSLRTRIKHYAPDFLPLEEVIKILSQIGQPLYYAHQQQIIHRDLKPENILFNAQDEALLSDFGIATTLSTASVKAVGLIGTPLYMAPEQFQGIISKESDQYALGCIAYELVTGQPPFNAPDFFALGFRHMSATPVPPRQINPKLPEYIEQAILKALAKQRNERHTDIRAFINALSTPVDYQAQMSTRPAASLSPRSQSSAALIDEGTTIARTTGSPGTTQQGLSHESSRDYTLTASYNNAHSPRSQGPVTPLPAVMQTPSAEQGPITPFPPMDSSGSFAGDEYPTIISAPEAREDVKEEVTHARSDASEYIATANGFMAPPPINTRHRRIFKSKRTLLIIAAACILLIASMIGVLVFALPSAPSQAGKTQATQPASTASTTLGQTTNPAQAGPNHQLTATTTHGPASSPTSGTTSTSTTGNKPTQVPTSIPTSHPTITPKPDPVPVTETLGVPFTSSGVATTHSYNGTVTISVSGTGQASQTQYSDAFYVYTNKAGTPNTPYHAVCWVLNINGQATDNFVSLPPYNPSHSYTFQIDAPGGQLTFNVCDGDHADNTGSYSITVTQN
ncbi:MAG: serine/threonine protein kinase [Ktedonobacteraceae bacterium]